MLELIARLLVALSVAVGAHGVATAGDHAAPAGNAHAVEAIDATIARIAAGETDADALLTSAPATEAQAPDVTGLDRALEVANDHAADGLAKAAAAGSAGRAKADAARSAHQPASGVAGGPPFDAPPVDGPPATHPPVPAPPVDAPGQGNRP